MARRAKFDELPNHPKIGCDVKHIGIVKADTLVSIMNRVGAPALIVYAFCMLVAPWFEGGWNWRYVQNVWDRWQTINAGLSALVSSVIAFNITNFSANKKRERQFVAARAFLPDALSELTSYCKRSSVVLQEAWEKSNDLGARRGGILLTAIPELPASYKETFSQCISVAESDVGDYLADLLVILQVHHSRMKELGNSFTPESRAVTVPAIVMSYLFSLGQLQAYINRLFGFARAQESFDASNLSWDDYRTAYANLNVDVGDIGDLEGFTRRAIKRNSSRPSERH